MLGPGVMRDDEVAAALIARALGDFEGASPLMLIPAQGGLVQRLYDRGARNCELHVAQQFGGKVEASNGIVMPTFMPETG